MGLCQLHAPYKSTPSEQNREKQKYVNVEFDPTTNAARRICVTLWRTIIYTSTSELFSIGDATGRKGEGGGGWCRLGPMELLLMYWYDKVLEIYEYCGFVPYPSLWKDSSSICNMVAMNDGKQNLAYKNVSNRTLSEWLNSIHNSVFLRTLQWIFSILNAPLLQLHEREASMYRR